MHTIVVMLVSLVFLGLALEAWKVRKRRWQARKTDRMNCIEDGASGTP